MQHSTSWTQKHCTHRQQTQHRCMSTQCCASCSILHRGLKSTAHTGNKHSTVHVDSVLCFMQHSASWTQTHCTHRLQTQHSAGRLSIVLQPCDGCTFCVIIQAFTHTGIYHYSKCHVEYVGQVGTREAGQKCAKRHATEDRATPTTAPWNTQHKPSRPTDQLKGLH
jgi:hypothetical protein